MLRKRALYAVYGWPPPEDTRETAWLDGMRGVAAVLVVLYHSGFYLFFGMYFEAPYGAEIRYLDDQVYIASANDIWRLPIFRPLLCSGHVQVNIFFILSGFVLSWSPLGHLEAAREERFYSSVTSSIFRRWFRLYLPCAVVALIFAVAFRFGVMDPPIPLTDTLVGQLWDCLKASEKFANPFAFNRDPYPAIHAYSWDMWTMPYEFAGSMMVYLLLVGTARFPATARILVASLVGLYAFLRTEWGLSCFAVGTMLAGLVRARGGFSNVTANQSVFATTFWYFILIAAVALAGGPIPSRFYDRPVYDLLDKYTPLRWAEIEGGMRFWWTIAGILFISAAIHLGALQEVFCQPFPRYLGRLSYMLYLTHRLILGLISTPVRLFLCSLFGKARFFDDPVEYSAILDFGGIVLMYSIHLIVVGPLVLFVAHWSDVLIDKPSIQFAKQLESLFMRKSSRKQEIISIPVMGHSYTALNSHD